MVTEIKKHVWKNKWILSTVVCVGIIFAETICLFGLKSDTESMADTLREEKPVNLQDKPPYGTDRSRACPNERAVLYINDKAVLVNGNGEYLSEMYCNITDFGINQRYLRYYDEDGLVGYLDAVTGDVIVEAQYQEAKESENIGYEIALVGDGRQWWYINVENGRAVSEKYDEAYCFSEAQGFYARVVQDNKWFIIDREFKKVVSGFDSITEINPIRFKAAGQKGKEGFLIDLQEEGKPLIKKILNQYTLGEYKEGYIIIKDKAEKYGVWVEKTGVAIEPSYDEISGFAEYIGDNPAYLISQCKKDGKYGKLLLKNHSEVIEIIQPIYEEPLVFSTEGIAAAKLNGTYGFVDLFSHTFLETSYKHLGTFYWDYIVGVNKNGTLAVIDKKGMSFCCEGFKEIKNFQDHFAIVIDIDNKYGIITPGDQIVECEYDSIINIENTGYYFIEKGSKKQIIYLDYNTEEEMAEYSLVIDDIFHIDIEHVAPSSISISRLDENGDEVWYIYNLFGGKIYSCFALSKGDKGHTSSWIQLDDL